MFHARSWRRKAVPRSITNQHAQTALFRTYRRPDHRPCPALLRANLDPHQLVFPLDIIIIIQSIPHHSSHYPRTSVPGTTTRLLSRWPFFDTRLIVWHLELPSRPLVETHSRLADRRVNLARTSVAFQSSTPQDHVGLSRSHWSQLLTVLERP